MQDKFVLMSGASSGIGEAIAYRLDAAGWRVIAGVRRQADAEKLQANSSERLMTVPLDVTDETSLTHAAHWVTEALGGRGLSALVNNAGIAVAGPTEFLEPAEWMRQFDVNVHGALRLTQTFIPSLRGTQGRIVMMSSISGRISFPFLAPYAASKFALEAIADSLRVELRPWGIETLLVQPGAVKTAIWGKSQAAAQTQRAELPPVGEKLYGATLDNLMQLTQAIGEAGVPATAVAAVVERALAARRPKARYWVGRKPRWQWLAKRLVPTRLWDSALAKRINR